MAANRTEALTAHLEYMLASGEEPRQDGVILSTMRDFDFLIDRTPEEWHRIHLHTDDGRHANIWYRRDTERDLISMRTSDGTLPDVESARAPQMIASALTSILQQQTI